MTAIQAPAPRIEAPAARRRRKGRLPFSPWHLVLIPATLVLIFPFVWLIITSVETPAEALHFPPILIPHTLHFANYPDALNSAPFGRFFLNSAVVAVLTVLANLVLCSLAGYAFARFRFLGRGVLFVVIMATLMVPFQVTMIPQFIITKWLGVHVLAAVGIDHIGALILPNAATAFGIFFLRQFFRTLPLEYEESARVDGASRLHRAVEDRAAAGHPGAGHAGRAHLPRLVEQLPVAADRDHVHEPDDAAARPGHVPGRALDRVDPADGGQRDEPGPDAADLLRGAAVLHPVGGRHRAGRDLTGMGARMSEEALVAATGSTEQEVASQPDCWRRAAGLAAGLAGTLPARGERVAVAGCGTSWFMAQSYAAAREAAGHGETDAFAASEMPVDRDYDRVLVLSRSGTTTEILQLLSRLRGRVPTVAITAVAGTPVAQAADAVIDLGFADEESVVQTRFATTELVLLRAHLGEDVTPAADAAERVLATPLPAELLAARQFTFLGTGWTYGLANEAALKLREAAGMWTEAYPAMEYRHGPVAVTGDGSVVWVFGIAPDGLADEVAAAGGTAWCTGEDPLAELVRVQRVAVALARDRGLDPDRPRNLARSVILADR